jgi:hypothetical protein
VIVKQLSIVLGVLVALFGWLWLDARSQATRLEYEQAGVVAAAVERERRDSEVLAEEAEDRLLKSVRRQVLACSELLNNYAGAERRWMAIIQGLVFDGRSAGWAEREWNDVILGFFAGVSGGDLRGDIAEACGVTRKDSDSQWTATGGSPSGG